ncbi:MAG TPA: hypothetical protein VGJ93_13680 [Desulfuromonadaceae bacterium]|jgi:hypothetical protein
MQSIEEIERKLFVLRNYEEVFKGGTIRQLHPICCGRELALGDFLRTPVSASMVEINGDTFTLFEVTCPTCGVKIPPEWNRLE